MKIVVLDGFAVNPGDLSWDFLNKYGEVTVYDKTSDSLAAERCKGMEIVFTNRVKITDELLKACPDIKLVSALGTGYDMIDINACRKRGICVCNVPSYSSDSVAQLTFMMILELTTDMTGIKQIVKDNKWTGIPGFQYQKIKYTELAGLTLGLVGCGSIGKRVAEMAYVFGMKVLASTSSKKSGNDGFIEFMELDEMLPKCDIVSIHCPLNDKTIGMVDKSFIVKMKTGAYLINTARGLILNEKDVRDAVDGGKLGGVAVDVLSKEPPDSSNYLLNAKNTIITPHIAWTTKAARQRLMNTLDKNMSLYISTGKGNL